MLIKAYSYRIHDLHYRFNTLQDDIQKASQRSNMDDLGKSYAHALLTEAREELSLVCTKMRTAANLLKDAK